uniref:AAA family ATPase n=1 Tax=Streptomyces sp. SM14 TaxID=1736045 RepID=UPI000CD4F775
MRLHRLTVTAFGPFAGTERVDFDTLAAAGVFLLHGPTGAGKTAILDAVCYALYGSVPGTRRNDLTALRSHHADPRTATEVVLDVTVEGRRLEITRRPDQSRPKKRGTGLTRDKAVSLLREHHPDTGWRGLSRSHQEIADEVGRLLGMNRDQFCQVVLLPQGDFARFLRADAEERAKLLGRLFDTSRFAAAEHHLATGRAAALDRLRAADRAVDHLLQRVQQAAGDPAPPPGAAEPDTDDHRDEARTDSALAYAAVARCAAREDHERAVLTTETAEREQANAQRDLAEATETARLQQRHAGAHHRAETLRQREEHIGALRTRLERSRAAEAVAPALDLREDAGAALRTARATEAAARNGLPRELADAAAEQLAGRARTTREQLGALSSAHRAEERADRLRAERAALDTDEAADRELLRTAERELAQTTERRTVLRAHLDTVRDRAAGADTLTARLEPARNRLAAARRATEITARLDDLSATARRAREDAVTAHEHWLAVREERLDGLAAELAATLTPGTPCAVCGATDHPRPAGPGASGADRATEEHALAAHQRATAHRQDTERDVTTARQELTALTELADGRDHTELAAEVDRLEKERAAARAAADQQQRATSDLATADSRHATLTARLVETRERSLARATRRTALDTDLAELDAESAGARAGAASVAERARSLEELADRLEHAAHAAHATDRAADRRKDADGKAADAAYRAGFTTPDDAATALLPDDHRRALSQESDHHSAE